MTERLILQSLRWEVDRCVYFPEYKEYGWLKAVFNGLGERIGITHCCMVGSECKHHKMIYDDITSDSNG